MPQVGAGNEPLLERLIFGYDGTSYRVVKVDADGNLVAALKAAQTVEVTQDTPADLNATATLAADQNVQARGYGWIAGAWQKQAFPFGVSARYAEIKSNVSLSAGTNRLDFGLVPAGEVWVANVTALNYVGTVAGVQISFQVYDGSSYYDVWMETSITSNKVYTRGFTVVLAAADRLSAVVTGATAGDALYASALGYKMDVDQ